MALTVSTTLLENHAFKHSIRALFRRLERQRATSIGLLVPLLFPSDVLEGSSLAICSHIIPLQLGRIWSVRIRISFNLMKRVTQSIEVRAMWLKAHDNDIEEEFQLIGWIQRRRREQVAESLPVLTKANQMGGQKTRNDLRIHLVSG